MITFKETRSGFDGYNMRGQLLFSVVTALDSGEQLFIQHTAGSIPMSDIAEIVSYAETIRSIKNDSSSI